MSIESTVISTAVGAIETVVPSPVAAFKWLKIGLVGIAALVACYLVYRVVSFVETAAADHAAVSMLKAQLDTAAAVNASNLVVAKQAADQHEAVVASANVAAAEAKGRANQLASDLETLRHAPPATGCRPSPAASALLQRLR